MSKFVGFTGRLQLDWGDFSQAISNQGTTVNAGKYAFTLSPINWVDGDVSVYIPAMTFTDGVSIPSWLWMILPRWGDISTIAGILHDFLLDGILDEKPALGFEKRSTVDRTFRKALIVLGVARWRAYVAWIGVRMNSICYETFGWPPQRSELMQRLMKEGTGNASI